MMLEFKLLNLRSQPFAPKAAMKAAARALVLTAFPFTLFLACSQMSDLKEMHDATVDMRKQTGELNAKTDALGNDTKTMKAITGRLYEAAKQGTSLQLRKDLFKDVVSAQTQPTKISRAGIYFMAFEYQLFSAVGPDTQKYRDGVAANAAKEFMFSIQDFIHPDTNQILAIASPETAEKMKANPNTAPLVPVAVNDANINAFACALQEMNYFQSELIGENPSVQPITMYSMLKDAVLADQEIEAGRKKPSDYPKYVDEIRSFMPVAKVLLRARANALAVVALTRVTTLLTDPDPVKRFEDWSDPTKKWAYETDKVDSKTIRDAATYLSWSIDTENVLKAAGIPLDEDGSAKKIFANAVPTPEIAKAREDFKKSGGASNERTSAFSDFLGQVDTYLK